MILRFLKEYLNRNAEAIEASKPLFTFHNVYSFDIAVAFQEATQTLVEETKRFCADNGYKIDRLSFVQVYDADVDFESGTVKSYSDTLLKIFRRKDGKLEAVVFSGAYIEASPANAR